MALRQWAQWSRSTIAWRLHFNEISNDELRIYELDFLEENRYESQSKLAIYQRKTMRYYNSRVKKRDVSYKWPRPLKSVFVHYVRWGSNSWSKLGRTIPCKRRDLTQYLQDWNFGWKGSTSSMERRTSVKVLSINLVCGLVIADY